MNVTKYDILRVLESHRSQWLKAASIAKELNLSTKEAINRISVLLYRLRNTSNIERRSNSHTYQYRYSEEIKGYPTNILPLSKSDGDKKARGDRDRFSDFTFIEPLLDITEGYCELCGLYTQLSYKAEKSNRWVFACKECGEEIKKQSEVFEWGRFG